MEVTRFGDRSSKHLYRMEVRSEGKRFEIEVDANSRDQARTIAQRAGYLVYSINMVG